MTLFFWIVILLISLIVLVKSADYFTESSEKIGLAMGLSPFVIGIIIVSIGTSLPELASAISAVLKGDTTLVAASVIGSNVANILLILGVASLIAGQLIISKDLIDLDLPLLGAITAIFIVAVYDRQITLFESILFLVVFIVYLIYSMRSKHSGAPAKVIPVKLTGKKNKVKEDRLESIPRLKLSHFVLLILSGAFLAVAANYTIESVIELGEILRIPASLVTLTVVAVGTSLPELIVSAKAARKKKFDIALGNILGSNVFNCIIVTGIPGLISPLAIDEKTYTVGLLFLVLATFLMIISGISKRIHIWEGLMFLGLYILFIANIIQI